MSGEFAACETTAEAYVVTARLLSLEALDEMLNAIRPAREHLRRDADQIARVGMKDLAALLRRHARKARRVPPIIGVGYQTKSARIVIARRRS
jgi:hypothetical protein